MANQSNMHVLVVDDEPDIQRGLQRILRMRGFDVETASDGEEAVRKVGELSPDAVLMDIRMPRMDGIAASRQIRKNRPGTLVIFMTAYSDLADRAGAEQSLDVVPKPIDIEYVCRLLQERGVGHG